MEPRLRSRMEDVSRCAMIENYAPSYRAARPADPLAQFAKAHVARRKDRQWRMHNA